MIVLKAAGDIELRVGHIHTDHKALFAHHLRQRINIPARAAAKI